MADVRRTLAFLLTGKDVSASKAMRGVKKEVESLSGIGAKAGKNLGRNIERAMLTAGTAAVGAAAYAIKAAGDFEAQLNTINTVAQVTPDRLAAIGDGIRRVSRETGTSTEDLTASYYDLVSAGVSAADAQMVLENANRLAIGGLSTTAEAVDLLTTAINSYGGDASKAAAYSNMFAEAIAAGKVTAADLAGSFAQVGPLAANAGIELKEVAAAIGVMTATGTQAPEAFTQIRAAMIALQRPTGELEKLQKKLKVNFLEMARDKGLAFTYNEIAKAAEKAGIPMIELTGRVEGANFAAQVAGDNYAKYAAELEKVEHSSDGAGVAQKQMEQRQKGLNYQLGILRANVHDAAITIGSELIPEFADLAKEATTWLQGHQPEIKAFAKDLAKGIREAVVLIRQFAPSLLSAAAAGRSLVGLFAGMPDWVKTAVISGWGLNKVTGGAVSDLIGFATRNLIKGVLGVNAASVSVKGGVVTVGGAGGGALGMTGTKGAAAGFGKAIAIAGTVMIAGEAIMLLKGILDEQSAGNREHEQAITDQTTQFLKSASTSDLRNNLEGLRAYDRSLTTEADIFDPHAWAYSWNIDGVRDSLRSQMERMEAELKAREAGTSTATPSQPPAPAYAHDLAGVEASLNTSAAALRAAAEAARAGRNRVEVIRGGGEAGVAVARDLVRQMQSGVGTWGQKLGNQQRVLEAIRAAEQQALSKGDTVVAGKLNGLAGQMTTLIAATKTRTEFLAKSKEAATTRFTSMEKAFAQLNTLYPKGGPAAPAPSFDHGEASLSTAVSKANAPVTAGLTGVKSGVNATRDAVLAGTAVERTGTAQTLTGLLGVRTTVGTEMSSTRAKVGAELGTTRAAVTLGAAATAAASRATAVATRSGSAVVSGAVRGVGAMIVAALYATRPIVKISATTVQRETNVRSRYGPSSGSRQSGRQTAV